MSKNFIAPGLVCLSSSVMVACDSGERRARVPKQTASALETTSMSWRVYRMWAPATPLTMVYSGMPFFSATSTVEVGQALRWMTVLIPASLALAISSSPSSSSPTALMAQPSVPFFIAW